MKAFIGRYYKSLTQATKAYNKLSPELRKNQGVIQVNGSFFIMSKAQIKALKK